jgi:Ca-activated chloride channel family protein
MKLITVLTLGATGLVAATAAVWFAANPARPAPRAAAAPAAPPAPASPAPPAPAPPDRSHFTAGRLLAVEGRLGHQVLPASTGSETFLYVDITADPAAAAARPAPLDLAIVIDRSGSMKGKRLANALAATRTAIDRLRDGDVVSVIAYDTRADVLVAPTTIDAGARARVLAALGRPRAGGDTCISCGIDAAMRVLDRRPGTVSRVLLFSDGLATAGVRDLPGFHRIADDVRQLGAAITTIGVDVGYDEKILAALARDSNGEHFFVPDPATLPGLFDRAMADLARTVAHDAELVVDLAPGVTAEHVYDRVATTDGSRVVVPFGAFAAGDHKTALMRLRVPSGTPGERAIAAVRVRYDDLVADRLGECAGELAVRASDDPRAVAALDGIVSARVSASESAAALETANQLFRDGRAADASRVIRAQHARLEAEHARARASTDPMRQPELDRAFAVQAAAVAGADEGFRPATPTAAAPVAGDRGAATQTRVNQASAVLLAH